MTTTELTAVTDVDHGDNHISIEGPTEDEHLRVPREALAQGD
ncbi:MAG: hypothetical protein QOI08_588 [Actinomycetota bacterium]|jgi:hypothetical protein|nr:hypothetical protein [Actinomycetota bacterium]